MLESVHFAMTMCVYLVSGSRAFRYPILSLFGGIFIYDFLLASNQMIIFSVKKFVERNFSPLTEKILAEKITVAIDLGANNS